MIEIEELTATTLVGELYAVIDTLHLLRLAIGPRNADRGIERLNVVIKRLGGQPYNGIKLGGGS